MFDRLLYLGGWLVLVLFGARAVPVQAQSSGQDQAGEGRLFAIQINASEHAASVTSQRDSLRRVGVPAYSTETTSEGTTYHRLRLGPFMSREDAQTFVRFKQYEGAWIVPAADDGEPYRRVVAEVVTDAVRLKPRPPLYYLGHTRPFVAVLLPVYGRSVSAPREMYVYTPNGKTPRVIEEVTGVREVPPLLEFGRAERVFIRDDPDQPAADFRDRIGAFSREHGLSPEVVKEGLAFYGGGTVARFTVLGSYAAGGDVELQTEPGFDYIGERGSATRHQGVVPGDGWKLGNMSARRLKLDTQTADASRYAALLARPSERGESAELCILFLE